MCLQCGMGLYGTAGVRLCVCVCVCLQCGMGLYGTAGVRFGGFIII